jgi:hypothetical protein
MPLPSPLSSDELELELDELDEERRLRAGRTRMRWAST